MGFDSISQRVKDDMHFRAALVAVFLGGLFSFLLVNIRGGAFSFGWSLPIEPSMVAYAIELLMEGDVEVFVQFPLYLLLGLVAIALSIAPFLLLSASFLVKSKSNRRWIIAIALAIVPVAYPIRSVVEGMGMPDFSWGIFAAYFVVQVALIVFAFASLRKKNLALILAVAMCAIFFVLMVMGIEPFGGSSLRYGNVLYIGGYLSIASLWIGAGLAIESMLGVKEASNEPQGSLKANEKQLLRMTSEPMPLLSAIDQVKELKAFLDAGVLTQEEFDAKKKELLNLGDDVSK